MNFSPGRTSIQGQPLILLSFVTVLELWPAEYNIKLSLFLWMEGNGKLKTGKEVTLVFIHTVEKGKRSVRTICNH